MKYLEKNIPGLQQMGMQFMALGTQEELRDQIIQAGLERACLQAPLPRNAAEFSQRKDEGKARLGLLVNEIARLAGQILAEYHALPKKLQGAKGHPQAVADIQAQLQALMGKRFIADNDYAQLAHFPRYLKAIGVRLEKLRADPARDAKLMAEWQQAAQPWQRAQKGQGARSDPRMAGIPLAAGRIAGVPVRPGITHADAGLGQAPAKSVGIAATLGKPQVSQVSIKPCGFTEILRFYRNLQVLQKPCGFHVKLPC